MSAPQIKVTYFGIPGRAELTRLLLSFGGIAFEDARVSGPEFGAMKATLPLGQLPVIEVNGTTYAQSMAMARYAAKLAGLYPQDAVAALRVDMISETLMDLVNAFITIKFGTPDEAVKAEKTKTFVEETVPKAFGVLESMVQGSFFGGESASIADVHLFDFVTNGAKPNFADFSTTAYPKLERVIANVQANANVAAYLAKHQK